MLTFWSPNKRVIRFFFSNKYFWVLHNFVHFYCKNLIWFLSQVGQNSSAPSDSFPHLLLHSSGIHISGQLTLCSRPKLNIYRCDSFLDGSRWKCLLIHLVCTSKYLYIIMFIHVELSSWSFHRGRVDTTTFLEDKVCEILESNQILLLSCHWKALYLSSHDAVVQWVKVHCGFFSGICIKVLKGMFNVFKDG